MFHLHHRRGISRRGLRDLIRSSQPVTSLHRVDSTTREFSEISLHDAPEYALHNPSGQGSRLSAENRSSKLFHKILAVAHFAAKLAQNTSNLCSSLYCKLSICIGWEYYPNEFQDCSIQPLCHSLLLSTCFGQNSTFHVVVQLRKVLTRACYANRFTSVEAFLTATVAYRRLRCR